MEASVQFPLGKNHVKPGTVLIVTVLSGDSLYMKEGYECITLSTSSTTSRSLDVTEKRFFPKEEQPKTEGNNLTQEFFTRVDSYM